ncbi:hypothetical protein [Streptomyces sp. NRRL S-1813]|uniref:hypothetical protein n=1 Tax=Streptomyces sp. NRRL S-1813 TaxID=1463888 RepID=UPI0004C63355|nr:hypothetical protein [Streptomyces sp. NRRL S-1813]
MIDKTIYHTPQKPEDPDAPYLTVQETAYVMRCSVNTVRRKLRTIRRGGGPGRRILVSREERKALHAGGIKSRYPSGRKPVAA